MMKRISIIVGIIALLPLTAIAQKWTIDDCVNYAMENNIQLKKSKLDKQTGIETRKQSEAALFPTLSASTNQSLGYKPWRDGGTTTVTNGSIDTKVSKTYYNGSYGINASWTVWNGRQNINQMKANKIAEEQAELTIAETANSIQEKIAQLFVQILYLKEAVKVEHASLETSKKNEERGYQMLEIGKMSKADLAQLTSQRVAGEYGIVEAQTQVENYMLQLRQLLEITDATGFDIIGPEINDSSVMAEIPSLESVYQMALSNRPEIINAQLGIDASNMQIKIARANWLPTLNMTAGLGTSSNSLSSNNWGDQMKTNFDASAGFTLSIPIIDGRKARTAVNKARIAREKAVLDLAEKQKTLHATIEGYWLDAVANQQKFLSAIATVNSEQESYNLLQEQFNLGLKNIVELMTGKDKLIAARYTTLQAKYTTILNQQMLKFYTRNNY